MRGFHDLRQNQPLRSYVHIVGLELKFNGLSNSVIRVWGFSGKDRGIVIFTLCSALVDLSGYSSWMCCLCSFNLVFKERPVWPS
jgi:hypothetical protein